MTRGPQAHSYEINAILQVSEACESTIIAWLLEYLRVRPGRIKSNLHLTVYHGRRPLPGVNEHRSSIDIVAPTDEMRLMVLAPGGENPRDSIDPRQYSVGLRLTRRNAAVSDIQGIREQIYEHETEEIVGGRKPTTAWKSCFGARNYQPHIQLLKPWHKVEASLSEIGSSFRSAIHEISFDTLTIDSRNRIDGQWVSFLDG